MKGKSKFSNAISGKAQLPPSKPVKKELLFSLRDFDHTQGQTFHDWHKSALLHILMERIKEFCKFSRLEAEQNNCLKVYGNFPVNSVFKHPTYISEDAEWASLHIQGKERIAGHIIGNIFYVVFLDKEHHFWPTKKKHT
jgi:hypothetical protein